MIFFSFPKQFTSVGWSSRCKFFWNALDPTLVIFWHFLKKITTTGSSPNSNGQAFGKFALDPVVVIFFKNIKKITSVGSRAFQKNLQQPCPFGLIKRLDPIVLIFFKKCQKIYKCWIKCISKKITTTGSANTCKFFWKWKNFDLKKNYNYGIKAPLKSHSCIFFWNQNFFISKKNYKCWLIQSL